jgi:ankyrin repeat protein
VRIRRLEYWIVGAIALLLLVLLFNINAVRRLTYTRFPELRRPLNEALHNAARKGDSERAAFLLERGADVNAEIGFTTPLMEAVLNDHKASAQLLLRVGASPNFQDSSKRTPFTYCMTQKNLHPVALEMLKRGADIHARDDNGSPIFFQAVYHDNAELIREMLNRGVDVNSRTVGNLTGSTALLLAVEGPASDINNKTLDRVRFLIARGADPNLRSRNNSNMTPFLSSICMYYGDPLALTPVERRIIVEMIKAGANVNEDIWEGQTPLMMAVWRHDAFVVSQLLKVGARVNARDKDGDTALSIARQEKQQRIIQLLKQAGAKG